MHTQKVDPESVGCDSFETDEKLKSDSVIWADCTVLFNQIASYIIVWNITCSVQGKELRDIVSLL